MDFNEFLKLLYDEQFLEVELFVRTENSVVTIHEPLRKVRDYKRNDFIRSGLVMCVKGLKDGTILLSVRSFVEVVS